MHSLNGSFDSLFAKPLECHQRQCEHSDDLDTESSVYSLYCRLTLGLRNADTWECITVHGESVPIFNAESTKVMSSSKFKVYHPDPSTSLSSLNDLNAPDY